MSLGPETEAAHLNEKPAIYEKFCAPMPRMNFVRGDGEAFGEAGVGDCIWSIRATIDLWHLLAQMLLAASFLSTSLAFRAAALLSSTLGP